LDFHEILICGSWFSFAHLNRWDLRDNSHIKEKKESHQDSTSGGFNPFSVSLTFGNSIGAIREKKLSQGTARDAAITSWRHVSPLRGKRWVIHKGSLEISIGMSFGVFLQFSFYPFNYYNELYMFYGSVDVPMRNCYEIDVFLCWVWTP